MILSNPKAELALLACCLVGGNETAREASCLIDETMFSDQLVLSGWRVVCRLMEQRMVVDLLAFNREWPKVVGGNHCPIEKLSEAMDTTWASRLSEHVYEVKEWTRRRKIHQEAQKLLAASANQKVDVEEALAACQASLRVSPDKSDREVGQGAAVDMVVADLEERQALNGKMSGLPTGLADLDRMTDGLQAEDYSVIGARPARGKSALLMTIASHISIHLQEPSLFVTLEMSTKQLLRRLTSMESKVELATLKRGQMTEQDFSRVTGFCVKLKTAPFWIVDGIGGMNSRKFAQVVRRYVEEHGIKIVFVDYLQKMRTTEKHEKRTYEVAEVTNVMKAVAVDNRIHVCSAAQLSREPDKASGKEKGRVPKISDLADSAQIERDADEIMLLHRVGQSDEASLILAKQRDGEEGIQHLWFDSKHCKFWTSTQETP